MKRQLLLALLAAGLAAAPGCADKRDAVPGIRITPSIKTRVTGLHFDTGDCIGLTVTKNGSDYVRNHQMTYDGSAFTASGLLWYNDLNETSTLTISPIRRRAFPTSSPWRGIRVRAAPPRTCWEPWRRT